MHITSTDDDWFKLVLWRKKSTFLLFEKIYRYRDEVFALQFNHLKQKVNLCELRVKRRKLTTAATIGYIPKTPFGLISSPEQNFQTSWRSGLKKVACVDSPWKKQSEKECVWVKRECVWEGGRESFQTIFVATDQLKLAFLKNKDLRLCWETSWSQFWSQPTSSIYEPAIQFKIIDSHSWLGSRGLLKWALNIGRLKELGLLLKRGQEMNL